MRYILPFLVFISISSIYGQDWMLVRPGWKYNYVPIGSDTITAQIFLTSMDTIGAPQYLGQLNTITTVCDTCTEQMVDLDQPQFLQRSVLISDGSWQFHDPGSIVLLPLALPGSPWLMDTASMVTAEVIAMDTLIQFGMTDVQKTIACSNGDQWVLSREWGIMHWNDLQLVGIHGPDVGDLIPSMAEMFPYSNGDEIQYEYGFGQCDAVGGCSGSYTDYKYTFAERMVQDTSVHFNGTIVQHRVTNFQTQMGAPTTYVHSYQNGSDTLIFSRETLPYFELATSFPGQLIHTQFEFQAFPVSYDTPLGYCIAEHGIDDAGRYFKQCRSVDAWGSSGNFFWEFEEGEPAYAFDNCWGGTAEDCGVRYTEGLGLHWFMGNYFESGESYRLIGAIVNGDTTGTVESDSIILEVAEGGNEKAQLKLYPNPVDEMLIIDGLTGGATMLLLIDNSGRVMKEISVSGTSAIMNVSSISAGSYLLLNALDPLMSPAKVMIIHK